jgi:hypothetical protein
MRRNSNNWALGCKPQRDYEDVNRLTRLSANWKLRSRPFACCRFDFVQYFAQVRGPGQSAKQGSALVIEGGETKATSAFCEDIKDR